MKGVFFLLAFALLTGRCFSQNADSLLTVHIVDSLLTIANNLRNSEAPGEALPFAQQAVNVSKQKWGENNAVYAAALHRLASVYQGLRQLGEAEELYLKAIDLRAKVLGTEHPDYAMSLQNLANLYKSKGDYAKSEPLYWKAIRTRAKALGKEHPDYAASLNNLANLYMNIGDYAKAEPLILESKEIWANVLGKEHPLYAQSLNNLANLYSGKGDYANAESLYLESKEIRAEALGKEHPDYAMSLNNLAILYMEKGDYAKAELLFLESIEILERAPDNENPEHAANLLSGLANLYMYIGKYAKAEPLYLKAIEIGAEVLGKEHPDYATSLGNLAILYFDKGDYAKAEPLFLETKERLAIALGKEHPDYATSLFNLASLYRNKGDYARAEALFLEADETWANTLGTQHPDYALSLNGLAIHYQMTNRIPESATFYSEMNERSRHLIEKSAAYSSENQMLAYLHTFNDEIAQFQSFSQTYPDTELIGICYDNALFFNGFLLENARLLARAVAGADSLTRETYNNWQAGRRRLANEYAKPIAERHAAAVIAEVEAETEGYEKTLARNLAAFSKTRRTPRWQDVRDHLLQGEAAIEFMHYRYYSPRATDSTMYAALLLRPGWNAPKLIPLFEEKQLTGLLRGNGIAAKANALYAVRGVKPLSGKNTLSKNLYELIWKPLTKSLKGVHTVYFSPSGLLSQLNLSAIPTAKGKTLADRYHLVQLGSTRQLIVSQQITNPIQTALLFGGIQYDMDSTALNLANADLEINDALPSRGAFRFSETDSMLRGGTWNYLPGTEKEVGALEQILKSGGVQTRVRKGYAATEEAFKSIGQGGKPSPRILHVATHGFFFPDPKDTLQRRPFGDHEQVFRISDNPMIRSGLILAGANHAWKTGKPFKPGMEDGILTAYEISQMNLSNTELVVLSACETGLGDIQGNEGVYGLQRAFKIAGAKYLIMSLWQVPDKQTSLLMTTFYKKWLEQKMTIPEAFRAAQKELRDAGLDPYQWAGFVLVE